jgi:KDO2-lipid IV(A) lauroyltransferase
MRIVRVLKGGGVLGAPMDLKSRVTSIHAPFFDRDAPTAIGPARIALRTGAAVVVGTFAVDEHGSPCVTATRIRTNDLEANEGGERELTARINEEITARIRRVPEHWVWMHQRF